MNKLFYISIVLFASCHNRELTGNNNVTKTSDETVNSANEIKEVVINSSENFFAGAFYKVDSIEITNDTLSVFVAYSGGCKEHSWDLSTNGVYNKSHPPEINLCLKHTSNGDACRQLIRKEIKFNITKLRYRGKKAIDINLGAYTVRYLIK